MALLAIFIVGNAIAVPYLQDNRTRNRQRNASSQQTSQDGKKAAGKGVSAKGINADGTNAITAQPLFADEDSIPDSLLHPRWPISVE